MNKFEKLIEYVINDEDQKAADLFHEIVVEKSRTIYEGLMDQDDEMGGDAADQLLDAISAEEEGVSEDEDEEGEEIPGGEEDFGGPDMDGEMGGEEEEAGEEDLEDRVADLENELDALMAEFDAVVGGGEDEMGMDDEMGDMGGEELPMGDEEDEMMDSRYMEADDAELEEGEEEVTEEDENGLEEGVALTKVTKGISNSTEEGSVNKRSINNDNSGKKGAVAKPVSTDTSEENGRSAPSSKDEGSTTEPDFKAAPAKPKTKGEESGTNTKSTL
jgi:hypothetical protein